MMNGPPKEGVLKASQPIELPPITKFDENSTTLTNECEELGTVGNGRAAHIPSCSSCLHPVGNWHVSGFERVHTVGPKGTTLLASRCIYLYFIVFVAASLLQLGGPFHRVAQCKPWEGAVSLHFPGASERLSTAFIRPLDAVLHETPRVGTH